MLAMDATWGDMVIVLIVVVGLIIMTAMIIYSVLRADNKIGPLASAEQRHEMRARSF